MICKLKKSQKKIKCVVELEKAGKRHARLVRDGRIYATGTARKLTVSRKVKRGSYELVVGHGDGVRRLAVRVR